MNDHYLTIDGKYPKGVSPFSYGLISGIWKFFIFTIWLMLGVVGCYCGKICFFTSLIPELILLLLLINRDIKWAWLVKPILNALRSAKMIEFKRPLHRTLFGYMEVENAPIIDVHKEGKDYILTFKPCGCPNADKELLSFLQQELPNFEVIPLGDIPKEYRIKDRRRKRGKLNNNDFD